MLTQIEPFFTVDYQAARARFVGVAQEQGRAVESVVHPLTGPDGGMLATDVVRIGSADASRLLVLTSGMHGPELYCGSGCQTAMLALGQFDDLPDDSAVLLVHAINPWGSAHVRRTTENNVDPCRNFIDFSAGLPDNPDYERLHPHLAFEGSEGPQGDLARASLAEIRQSMGAHRYRCALMSGQYRHRDGFSYGGNSPEWTNLTMTDLLKRHAEAAEKIATIDFHSGVGPWGYGLAVVIHEGEALARARRWYGEWVLAPDDASVEDFGGYTVTGHSNEGYQRALSGKELTAMVLEFGTYPTPRFVKAMTNDHWLTFHGGAADIDESCAIKMELASLFNPDDAEWREAVWQRTTQAVWQALQGLTAG